MSALSFLKMQDVYVNNHHVQQSGTLVMLLVKAAKNVSIAIGSIQENFLRFHGL
jgi:hypothetical protein